MADHFLLLDEPRRPWLDVDLLKEKFFKLSAQFHPDRVHNAPEVERIAANKHFTDLNSAYECLREPKERLRHLLELESGAKPADIQGVSADLVDWQFEIGKLCRGADAFIADNEKISSPIVKAQRFGASLEWTDKLQEAQQKINSRRDDALAELKTMDATWDSENHPLDRVENIYRLLGYLGRWSQQLQERIVRLAV